MASPALAQPAAEPAGAEAAPAAAAAPAASDVVLQPVTRLAETIITADRRADSLQAVPLAVTALPAATLETRHLQSTGDLLSQVPNAFGARQAGVGSANSFVIRGLGISDSIATLDAPVGLYFDDIYIARQNLSEFGFFDIDRVEVLRGPQGTLRGRNTTGGAIDIVNRVPGKEIAGFGEFRWGAYDTIGVRGAFNMPLSAGIALQLSGYTRNDDGYVTDRTTGQRLNDSDGSGLRLAARVDLAPDLQWRPAVTVINSNAENLLNFRCDPANPSDCSRRFATTGVRETNAGFGALGVSGGKAEFNLGNRSRTVLWSSNLEWGGDALRVNLITGVVDTSQDYALDFADGRGFPSVADPVPAVRGFAAGGYSLLNQGRHRQFSQEVRVSGRLAGGRIDYVAGALFFNETSSTDLADVRSAASGTPQVLADRRIDNRTVSTAGYGQADVMLATNVQLTAGIRYTEETKRFAVTDNRAPCAGSSAVACLNTASLAAAGIPTAQTTRDWSPRLALAWIPTGTIMVYGSATRGYRSGGWNARGLTADALTPFGREQAWTYEAGLRSEWFDERLRANVTGFILDVDDAQVAGVGGNGLGDTAINNDASMNNIGIEVDLAATPVRGLNLWVNGGWQRARYHVRDAGGATGGNAVARQLLDCRAQLAAGGVPLLAGAGGAPDCATGIVTARGEIARPPQTPQFTIAAGASYDFALPAAGIVLTPQVDVTWRSSYETGSAGQTLYTGGITAGGVTYPANPFGGSVISGSRVAAAAVVNAGLAMRTDDGNWTVAIECSNCFDAVFGEQQLALYTYLNSPRRWQLRLKRAF
ncbi:hypothetical protein IP88_10865 [alpha proteobacterium AAP81b]|nr:hypothetical protein IP88_10865 [alpha proteobacterium AAP81b]